MYPSNWQKPFQLQWKLNTTGIYMGSWKLTFDHPTGSEIVYITSQAVQGHLLLYAANTALCMSFLLRQSALLSNSLINTLLHSTPLHWVCTGAFTHLSHDNKLLRQLWPPAWEAVSSAVRWWWPKISATINIYIPHLQEPTFQTFYPII